MDSILSGDMIDPGYCPLQQSVPSEGKHTQVHTLVCQPEYSRQVVKVLCSASRPDSDPVDLVVQAVQEETQELLSVLLAARHTERTHSVRANNISNSLYSDVLFDHAVLLFLDSSQKKAEKKFDSIYKT